MDIQLVVMIVATLLLVALGVATLMGKADWAIKQYRRNSERYNLLRLRIITGAMLIIVAIFIPFILFYGEHERTFAYIIIGLVVVFAILQETWARRR
ncbi:MAG: hypothetical protein IJE99_06490 [Alistipes sp.]|nr:hypothetical protein [Alistipes sp.]